VHRPGDLVQRDTVHLYDYRSKRRSYLYTAVDLYSRWAYAEYHTRLSEQLSIQFLTRAETYAGFHFACVQADNGPEYGQSFAQGMQISGTQVRTAGYADPMTTHSLNALTAQFRKSVPTHKPHYKRFTEQGTDVPCLLQ
jgi:hypothetical protein